ncbi:MAG: hypothetical protein RR889_00560, partial [Akkermansia sp.]
AIDGAKDGCSVVIHEYGEDTFIVTNYTKESISFVILGGILNKVLDLRNAVSCGYICYCS